MINEELKRNYTKSLNQKYNAVCFDIDGTLTENNSTKIDSRVLPILADLLKKHIPIVFITGRGETGLNDLLKEIVYDLQSKYSITTKQLSKIYALTNDGARIFMTKGNKELFNVSEYIATNADLIMLNEVNNKIVKLLSNTNLEKYCKISYSIDSQKNNIINIRLSILTKEETIINEVINTVDELIKESGNKNINLTIGMHRGQQILQIGTTKKSIAIEVTERIIGIPQNSMLRIGDCGDQKGNDYSMLNCPQGFSVDKTSQEIDRCFPVIENDKILKGVEATIALLKQVKLVPTICLEHATEADYTKAYARIESKMNFGKNQNIAFFNDLINHKFKMVEGINGLYDSSSGSIKIQMCEWISIPDNNPLKQFWLKQNNMSLCYAMYDNDNILLRGSQIYYYFLSNRYHDETTGDDITTNKMIYNWLNNNKTFYLDALEAMGKIENLNEVNNMKMILGLIDNIRNYLLILLNEQIVTYNSEKNIIINLEQLDKNALISKIYTILLEADTMMKDISFDKKHQITYRNIQNLINKVLSINEEFYLSFSNEPVKENYSSCFRAYREIDNFAENFITCYLTAKKDDKINQKGFCGLCYGGIELPIIMRSIESKIEEVSILKFNKNVTGYSKKQSLDLRFFNIFEKGGIELIEINKEKDYILLDDNLLTGKTMQLALISLYDIGINVDKIMVVRYPGVNRISQMFMPNHGAVDYRHFFEFIQGLYFPSPYSRRDPYSPHQYEDSLGVFDLNRRKISECLIKNGDYSQNSEIVHIKRMVKNENN